MTPVPAFVALSDAEAERTVLRSRFLAVARRVESEAEAEEKLAALRKKYFDATHICYAYIADVAGNIGKSSDDGEPVSTAGAPIMAALTGGGFRQSLIAVVRWFGGTKLGVGGLVKAYGDAAAAVVGKSEKRTYVYSDVVRAEVGYEMLGKIKNAVESGGGKILAAEYGGAVKLTIAFPAGNGLLGELTDLTRGKTEFIPGGRKYEIYRM